MDPPMPVGDDFSIQLGPSPSLGMFSESSSYSTSMNPPSDMPRAEAVDLRALLLLVTMNADDDDDDDDNDGDGSSIKVVRACLVVGVAFVA